MGENQPKGTFILVMELPNTWNSASDSESAVKQQPKKRVYDVSILEGVFSTNFAPSASRDGNFHLSLKEETSRPADEEDTASVTSSEEVCCFDPCSCFGIGFNSLKRPKNG